MPITPYNNPQTAVQNIRIRNSSYLSTLKTILESSMNDVWYNPSFTPSQILTAFGSDAAELFTTAAKLIELIAMHDPVYVPPSPSQAFTINQDGTVTVHNQ